MKITKYNVIFAFVYVIIATLFNVYINQVIWWVGCFITSIIGAVYQDLRKNELS